MRFAFVALIQALNRQAHQRFKQSWSDVRPERVRYMLIFALAPLFANLQGHITDESFCLFGLDTKTWMGASYCLGAGLLFILTRTDMMHKYAKLYSSLSLVSFFSWIIWPNQQTAPYLAFIFTFCFGGTAAVAAYFFTYALNRSERFLGAAVTVLFATLSQFAYSISPFLQNNGHIYMGILVSVTFLCMLSFQSSDAQIRFTKDKMKQDRNSQILVMLYFFFAHKLIEVFYSYSQDSSTESALRFNGIVGVVVLGISLFLYFRSKYSLWHMCNLFFLFMLLANLFSVIPRSDVSQKLSQVFHGFELIGFVSSYALLGDVLSEHADFRLFRRILIIALNASLLIYLIPGILVAYYGNLMLYISASISLVLFLLFLLMTPRYVDCFVIQKEIGQPTIDSESILASLGQPAVQTERADLSVDESNLPQDQNRLILEETSLTKREKQVVSRLLQGYLYKQCAVELEISTETVKFHARNAYRKLGVAGRSELFALFLKE